MIDLDRWHSARDFAGYLRVHPLSIYQSQPHLGSSKLPLPVPVPIKIGRALRWTGRQIVEYQAQLAELSGVTLQGPAHIESTSLAQVWVAVNPPKPGPGRPRKAVATDLRGAL